MSVERVGIGDHRGRFVVGEFGKAHYAHIYAIAPKGGGCIKFGYALNVAKRLSSIQTGSPVKLKLLGSVFVPVDVEVEIHDFLRDHRSHGEWFYPTMAVMELADKIAAGDARGLLSMLSLYRYLPLGQADRDNFETAMNSR